MKKEDQQSKIVIYQSEDGQAKIDVHFKGETAWLTQKLMAELFDVAVPTINEHLKNIFETRELNENSVIRNFRITAADGKTYDTKHYNLDCIIALGYRVNSIRATQFRIWATQRLREYIIKGFALDDERLKQGGGRARYFEELLQRIRDIRSSERNFYQKVTDIYATSVHFRKDDQITKEFFATVNYKNYFMRAGHTFQDILNTMAVS